MTFIDFFAGVGGFRRGMELAGHKCVGFCEADKHATMSYTSMHLITEEQREYLATLPLKERQKEILKDEYRNGEWYSDDIRNVDATGIPRADCYCAGFPCQDISIGGKQLGFDGNRSSLFFEVMRIVNELQEEDRPEWLFFENVKNILSVNRGWDFARVLFALDESGYDTEWGLLNSKDFDVPQNRERVFIVGHLRGRGGREVFPIQGADGKNDIQHRTERKNGGDEVVCKLYKQIPGQPFLSMKDASPCDFEPESYSTVTARYYKGIGNHKDNMVARRVYEKPCVIGGVGTPDFGKQFHQQHRVYDVEAISPCIQGAERGNGLYHQKVGKVPCKLKKKCDGKFQSYRDATVNFDIETASTLLARYHKGIGGDGDNMVAEIYEGGRDIALPCLTPDRETTRQNGRRFKEDGEPSFTLTARDRHGVAVSVDEPVQIGFYKYPNSDKKHQSNTVYDSMGISPCLDTCEGGNRQVKCAVPIRMENDGDTN